MPTHRLVLLLALLPGTASAQAGFHQLMDGAIAYRTPLPWKVVNRVRASDAEGVILEYRAEEGAAVTLAIFAHDVSRDRRLGAWSDSVLARARPVGGAVIVRDTTTFQTRSLLWRADALIAMDRFFRTSHGILWVRVVLPSAPLNASTITSRLRAIDDVLTTIRDESHLFFPDGSGMGVTVRTF